MNTSLNRFIAKILALSTAIVLVGWLAFSLFIPQYYLSIFPYALVFFLIVAIAVHTYQLKLAKKDIGKFTRSTMLITFFKLIVYSVFAVVYIANDPENALVFVIALFFLYLVFSFVEVSEITRISKRKDT
ncbi:hypothetical protein [Maribellus maritimus]|uniref:hypothetical protein n=1 Tax=Maribellus maritimus TaxID=2870838 RepID=UPI001EEC80BC|nr:hypothetical protein [Maribellus maritimus]MCG6188167.1 hypothetical protein [Maribellus maritimus]